MISSFRLCLKSNASSRYCRSSLFPFACSIHTQLLFALCRSSFFGAICTCLQLSASSRCNIWYQLCAGDENTDRTFSLRRVRGSVPQRIIKKRSEYLDAYGLGSNSRDSSCDWAKVPDQPKSNSRSFEIRNSAPYRSWAVLALNICAQIRILYEAVS